MSLFDITKGKTTIAEEILCKQDAYLAFQSLLRKKLNHHNESVAWAVRRNKQYREKEGAYATAVLKEQWSNVLEALQAMSIAIDNVLIEQRLYEKETSETNTSTIHQEDRF